MLYFEDVRLYLKIQFSVYNFHLILTSTSFKINIIAIDYSEIQNLVVIPPYTIPNKYLITQEPIYIAYIISQRDINFKIMQKYTVGFTLVYRRAAIF